MLRGEWVDYMTDAHGANELSGRALYLLKLLVERYIAEGQPLGSRTLARHAQLELSPATIRNVMADLEDIGLVCSPHTSAGRVPTDRGYRLFVDSLLKIEDLSVDQVKRMSDNLDSEPDVTGLVRRASSMLSEVTRLAGVVMIPRTVKQEFRHVEFMPLSENRLLVILVLHNDSIENRIIKTDREYSRAELERAANYLNQVFVGRDLHKVRDALIAELGEVKRELDRLMEVVIEMAEKVASPHGEGDDYVLAGETNLMDVTELSDIQKLRKLFDAFNQKHDILHILDQSLVADGVQIFIGEESGYDALGGCSLVTSNYESEGKVLGVLGIIGPTRMAYDRVIPVVDLTAKLLGSALNSLH